LADAFLTLYPSATIKESMLATTRDALYSWTAVRLAKRQAALGVPSYLYLFHHGYKEMDNAGFHAFHGSELPYMFGTVDRTTEFWPKIPATAEERRLTGAMVGYWTSFAKSGAPQAANAPDWPAYGSAGAYMAFEDAPRPSTNLFPGMYALHEEAVCRRRAEGDLPWNWNTGLASPTLPAAGACRAKRYASFSAMKPAAINLAMRFLTAGKSSERQIPPDRRSMRPERASVFIKAPVTK